MRKPTKSGSSKSGANVSHGHLGFDVNEGVGQADPDPGGLTMRKPLKKGPTKSGANGARGHLGFEVGGVTYIFAFSTNALCAVEDHFEIASIDELDKVLGKKPSLRQIRTLFRLGLTDLDPDMTDVEAGKIMDAVGGLEPSAQLVMKALSNAFPEAAASATADPR